MRILVLLFLFVGLSGCLSTPVKKKSELKSYNQDFENQLSLVVSRSKDADFTKLRMTYTDTDLYMPYGSSSVGEIMKAMHSEKFEQCAFLAKSYLTSNAISLPANYAALVCHSELGKSEEEHYYKFVLDGLIDSIYASGDGLTVKTAFITISTEELRTFIELMGLKSEGQALIRDDGRIYDKMSVKDEDNKEFSLYFDITIQMVKGMKFLDE